MLGVTLGGEEWKMTPQYSLFASVYNSIKQYKGKTDLTFLPNNQVQLLAEKTQKIKVYHTNQMLYGKTIEARQGETIPFSNI